MVKRIIEDTFEKIAEQGGKAAKNTIKQLKQTVSPTKMWEEILGVTPTESFKKSNHTPLDFEKLGKSYKDQEKQKEQVLVNKLFQYVKSGEEKAIMENRKKEQERKKKELAEEQEKKRKEAEKQKVQMTQETPRGKIRRNIFSPKKIAERQHAEVKPAGSKQ